MARVFGRTSKLCLLGFGRGFQGVKHSNCIVAAFPKTAPLCRKLSVSCFRHEEMSERQYAWTKNLFLEDPTTTDVTTEDLEHKEKQELLEKFRELYFANPPKEPGEDLYIEAFELLMKHEDSRGVEAVVGIMQESNVKVSEEYLDKVEEYLVKAKDRSWFD